MNTGGKLIGKPLGLKVGGGKKISVPIPGIKSGYRSSGSGAVRTAISAADDNMNLPRQQLCKSSKDTRCSYYLK
jgi:hypothetical protein